MNEKDVSFLQRLVGHATAVGKQHDWAVEIYEVSEHYVMMRGYDTSETDGELALESSVTARVEIAAIGGETFLEVHVDGTKEPVHISPHGWVLLAVLYAVP